MFRSASASAQRSLTFTFAVRLQNCSRHLSISREKILINLRGYKFATCIQSDPFVVNGYIYLEMFKGRKLLQT